MEAEFYFNDIFVGVVNNIKVQIAMEGFVGCGPKAIVQFFCNKEVVDQWFILQILDQDKPNKIVLKINEKVYKIDITSIIIPIPIIDSDIWKFKLSVIRDFNNHIKLLKEVVW